MKKDIFKGISLMNMLMCLCVVMIHITSVPISIMDKESSLYPIMFFANKSLCFAVPAFIFMSGFKLYCGYGSSKVDLKKFYTKRLRKIVLPYVISVLVYYVYYVARNIIDAGGLIQYIFLGTMVAHFYYVIIAVQLYLVFPFLKEIFNKYEKTVVVIALLSTVCFNEFFKFTYSDRFVGSYILYFVMGMSFARHRSFEKQSKSIFACIAMFALIAVVHVGFLYMAMSGKAVYNMVNIVNIVYVTLATVVIYYICACISENCNFLYKFSKDFEAVSYNVYLYHILLLIILRYEVSKRLDFPLVAEFALLLFGVYLAVFGYALLQKRISGAKRKTDSAVSNEAQKIMDADKNLIK